jgi:hypothetical protein
VQSAWTCVGKPRHVDSDKLFNASSMVL